MTTTKTNFSTSFTAGKTKGSGLVPARKKRVKTAVAAPKSLSLWRVFSVLACLVGAVFSFVSISAANQLVNQVGATGHQVSYVQMAKARLLAADGLAVSSLAGGQTGGQLDHSAELSNAADAVSMAVAGKGQDYAQDAHLPAITHEITEYAFSLGQTVVLAGQPGVDLAASVSASEEKLRSGVIPAIDTFIQAEQNKIDQKPWTWVGVGLVIPLGVLIIASVKHAKLTRRIFNVGLLAAVVMVGFAGYQVADAGLSSARYKLSSGSGLYSLTQQYSQTQVDLAQALNIDGQLIVQTGDMQALKDQWQAAIDQARAGGGSDELDQQLTAYEQAHKAMLDSPGDAQLIAANATAAMTAITTVEEMSSAALDSFFGDVNQRLHSNSVARLSATALCLLGALACGVGLAKPLRKYR